MKAHQAGLDRRSFLTVSASAALSAAIGGAARAQVATATALAKTNNGPIIGLVYDGIETFKGVRYGAPPVGALRFAPPQKPAPWSAPADATHFGNAAMQLRSGGSAVAYP